MRESPFGPESDKSSFVFGHRDRVDEARDLACWSGQDFLYIRNYMPTSYNQPTAWPDLGEIRRVLPAGKEWKNESGAVALCGAVPSVEELYDCGKDPQNLNNLVESNDHRAILVRGQRTRGSSQETRDLGFLPEFEAWQAFEGAPVGRWENPVLLI